MVIRISAYIICFSLLLSADYLYGQDQKVADSIKLIINETPKSDTQYLILLEELAFNEQDPILIEKYSDLLITEAKRDSIDRFIRIGLSYKGQADLRQGNLEEALESLFKSTEYAINENDVQTLGRSYSTIADIYSESGNSDNAILFYDKAIASLWHTPDTIALASTILNAGDEFLNQAKYSKAQKYFKEAEPLFEEKNYQPGIAYNLGNQGIALAGLGQNKLAEEKLYRCISILEELEDFYSISVYLNFLSELYLEKNDNKNATKYAERSLSLAKKYGLKGQISEASLQLSNAYDRIGNKTKALELFKNHIVYRDSFNNVETVHNLANMRTDFEVSQKQLEVNLLEEQRKTQRLSIIAALVGLGTMIFLAIGLYRRNRYINNTRKIIESEKEKSDKLLLNILPAETAEELKQNGKVAAKKHETVSVFFSDFVGFTKFSEHLSPDEVVAQLDYYFSHFDNIAEKYGVEKIKTIGDAYMCTSGLNDNDPDHAMTILKVAKEIQEFVHTSIRDMKTQFEIRIGINSGPVVAGVVGHKKFAYDIWGNTVNIAARMEANSKPGKINISENTYHLVHSQVDCAFNVHFTTKNGSAIKMYFVNNL